MTTAVKERTNTQISLSFGRDELELLNIMDEARKRAKEIIELQPQESSTIDPSSGLA